MNNVEIVVGDWSSPETSAKVLYGVSSLRVVP
jgi:hypothetical protein